MRQEQIDYMMKDKDIFDLTRQEFEIYFEHVTRGKLNFLMSVMKVLDEIFVKDKHGNKGLGLGLVSWFIFGVPLAVWFMFISGIIGDFIPLPHKVENFLIYLPDAYPILCPIISFIIIFAIFLPITFYFWALFTTSVFDKPAKKIIFKALGMEYYRGLFYYSDFEYIAKYFSKILFRVDEMILTKYKGEKLAVFDCIEKGFSHKIFIATKVARKFPSKTLVATKGSLRSLFFEGSEVKLEDVKFAKVYNVFSDDQVEARYILTPTFMERLLQYNPKKAGNIQVFFTDTLSKDYNVFFYIPVNDNWFEMPSSETFAKYIHPSWFYSFIEDIKEIMQVVEALKLDQNIGM